MQTKGNEAYKAYLPMPYDRPTWDLTAVLYAVEGERWFALSKPGTITVNDKGGTHFKPEETGMHRYLIATPQQKQDALHRMVEMAAPRKTKK